MFFEWFFKRVWMIFIVEFWINEIEVFNGVYDDINDVIKFLV